MTEIERFQESVLRLTPHDGFFETGVPGLRAVKRSKVDAERVHILQEPTICFVAQGAKRLILGTDTFEYDPNHLVLCSVAVPAMAQIMEASSSKPFLCVRIDLDPALIGKLILKVKPRIRQFSGPDRLAIRVAPVDDGLLSAVRRLVDAASMLEMREHLSPLILEEIVVRLLMGPAAPLLIELGTSDSATLGINRAVSWLSQNFAQPLDPKQLADMAHMSLSSFYQYFRSVTSMSPLEFQKALRLQSARQLLLSRKVDVGEAGYQVGYASASQFSHEYRRFFGDSPTRDIEALQQTLASAG
jgi:AraC-like DNA-binding protein